MPVWPGLFPSCFGTICAEVSRSRLTGDLSRGGAYHYSVSVWQADTASLYRWPTNGTRDTTYANSHDSMKRRLSKNGSNRRSESIRSSADSLRKSRVSAIHLTRDEPPAAVWTPQAARRGDERSESIDPDLRRLIFAVFLARIFAQSTRAASSKLNDGEPLVVILANVPVSVIRIASIAESNPSLSGTPG